MVVYTYNPSTWVGEAGRLWVWASLGYVARPCLRKKTKALATCSVEKWRCFKIIHSLHFQHVSWINAYEWMIRFSKAIFKLAIYNSWTLPPTPGWFCIPVLALKHVSQWRNYFLSKRTQLLGSRRSFLRHFQISL
jgi:hypothetical protein